MKFYLAILTIGISFAASAKTLSTETREPVQYLCKARSLLGKYYSAVGDNETLTQNEAMKKCEMDHFRCYPTGCVQTGTPTH